jgi:hypothetical protein
MGWDELRLKSMYNDHSMDLTRILAEFQILRSFRVGDKGRVWSRGIDRNGWNSIRLELAVAGGEPRQAWVGQWRSLEKEPMM